MSTATTYIETEKQLVPELRFKEFVGDATQHLFEDIFLFSSGKNIKQAEASPEFETPCVRYGELYHMYGEVINEVINILIICFCILNVSIYDKSDHFRV